RQEGERAGAEETLPRGGFVRPLRRDRRDDRGLPVIGSIETESHGGPHRGLRTVRADHETGADRALRAVDLDEVLADPQRIEPALDDADPALLRCIEQRSLDEAVLADVTEVGLADFGRVEHQACRWRAALVPDPHALVGAQAG